MSKIRVNTVVNRTNSDKVTFPFGIGVTNGIEVAGVVTATSFVGSGASLTGVPGEINVQAPGVSFTGITTIFVGAGLSLTNGATGVATITNVSIASSDFDYINVTGIGTIAEFKSDHVIVSGVATAHSFNGGLIGLHTGRLLGEVNSTGINTLSHIEGTHLNLSGVATISELRSDITSPGISTFVDLQTTNLNVSGITTANILNVTDINASNNLDVTGIVTFRDLADFENGIVVNNGSLISDIISDPANAGSTGISTIKFLQGDTINITGVITASSFSGSIAESTYSALSGVATHAGIATAVTLVATNNTNAVHYVTFVDTATGNENVRTDTDLMYNPNTGILTATTFSGNATGLTGTPDVIVGHTTSFTILPASANTYDLGASSNRWANIYSADMHFSNEGGANDVDGTWGDWTLQEGENDIFMLNNRTGKKYKINLTEV